MKTKPKYASKSHAHPDLLEQISELRREVRNLSGQIKQARTLKLTVFSADNETCVGMNGQSWHRIVCLYDGNRCLGGPRPHWHSDWEITEKGLSICSFLDEKWKGWHGQYAKGELRYDEISRPILNLHIETLRTYMNKEFALWFPCHIYDDVNGNLYRP